MVMKTRRSLGLVGQEECFKLKGHHQKQFEDEWERGSQMKISVVGHKRQGQTNADEEQRNRNGLK